MVKVEFISFYEKIQLIHNQGWSGQELQNIDLRSMLTGKLLMMCEYESTITMFSTISFPSTIFPQTSVVSSR